MMRAFLLKLILCILICVGIGGWAGAVTAPDAWFIALQKPSWQPPNWLFAPVWTLLYAMIGTAFALIWHSQHPQKLKAIRIFVFQFALNLAWSFIFFSLKMIGLALLEIVLLLIFIIWTMAECYPVDKRATYLLVPYVCWVGFATALTATIWWLNY